MANDSCCWCTTSVVRRYDLACYARCCQWPARQSEGCWDCYMLLRKAVNRSTIERPPWHAAAQRLLGQRWGSIAYAMAWRSHWALLCYAATRPQLSTACVPLHKQPTTCHHDVTNWPRAPDHWTVTRQLNLLTEQTARQTLQTLMSHSRQCMVAHQYVQPRHLTCRR
jgi:hypothetical protein